jgi:hypothetical protein
MTPGGDVVWLAMLHKVVRHMVAACRSLGRGGRFFLFADQKALPGDVLGDQWGDGRGETLSSLLLPRPFCNMAI